MVHSFFCVLAFALSAGMASALDSNVLKWSVSDVQEWASTAGFSNVAKAQDTIQTHGVTGKILLFVEVDDLRDEFGLSNMEAKAIAKAIVNLQDTPEETPVTNGHGHGKGGLRLDFYEYRAMNRKEFYKIAGAMTMAPRFALYDIHETFDAHALPDEPISTVLWVLFPEFWIWQHNEAILGGLPFGLLVGMAFTVIAKISNVVIVLAEDGKSFGAKAVGAILGFFLVELIVILAVFIYYHTFWYIIPWFVNDAIFWLQMYVFPLCQLIQVGIAIGKNN